ARAGSAMRAPGLRVLVPVFAAVGATFGTIEVSMVAFAAERGETGASGPLLALLAFGSLVAGLLYGAVHWRRGMRDRFVLALAAFAVGTVPLALAPSVGVMAGAVAMAGLTIAPTLVAGIGLVEALVPTSARTEGFTWVSTALGAGFAPGAYLAGWIIDASGAHQALFTAVGTATLALVVALAGMRVLGAGRPAQK
ncbi:MAG TPA: MFS transporter, partial [Mycobacteriales bacterium]